MTRLNRPVKRTTHVDGIPHGITPDLVITLYPGGVIGLRELRRQREYTVKAGSLYARLVAAEARRGRGRRVV